MMIASSKPISEEERHNLPLPRLRLLPLELGVVMQLKTHTYPLQAIIAVRMATIETRLVENWKARTIKGITKLAAGLLASNLQVRLAIPSSTTFSMNIESPSTLTTWIDLQARRLKSVMISIVSTTMMTKLMRVR